MVALNADVAERTARYKANEALRKDPKLYFKNILGVQRLENYQSKVIDVVANNDRIAIKACHDLGKTFLMARIAMWFLNMHPNSKVITTAPTFTQVERILWSEIRAAHGKAKLNLGGKLNMTDWTYNPEWFALGLSPRNEANANGDGQGTQSSFQGYHAPYLLVIFDEATGIPHAMWNMVEGLLTSAHVKFVAIGNPTSMGSSFYSCFKDKAWAKVGLTCFDSPNLIANGITNKQQLRDEVNKVRAMNDEQALEHLKSYKAPVSYLLTTKWVVEQTMKWGFDHPLTISKIFGEFPEAGDDTLVPLGFVESSQLRVVYPSPTDRKCIGVDVARFGSDSSILTGIHGPKQLSRKPFYLRRTTEITGEVINMARDMGGVDVIVVDETGLGAGVVDELIEAKSAEETKALLRNTEIRGVQFGAGCEAKDDKEKYVNMKARMFDLLSKDLADEVDGFAVLPESIYLEELPTIKKRYNSKGQLFIESKDDYKKRTGRNSPDSSDSLALANFGRYDDLKIGTFDKKLNDKQNKRATLSGSLRAIKNW